MSQQAPKNYLKQQASATKTRLLNQLPDRTAHHPPVALFALGAIGVLAGFGTNCWQLVTTFTGVWSMFNPNGSPIDLGKQPALFAICALIACSFQLALLFLIFRLDSGWKKQRTSGQGGLRDAAVEIVQHVDLVILWGGLGFVVDTIGDYTFISIYTARLDAATATFLIFVYAVALYAVSTVGFVRALEYLWAGFAAADRVAPRPATPQKPGGNEA